MASAGVELAVGGRIYAGWKSVRVTSSIESLAGSFSLDVSDRWGDAIWPIAEEDPCRVLVGGHVVIDGYVDKRTHAATASTRTLTYSGRDRAAALVDCSALLGRWIFRDVDVAQFAASVAAPFGVGVNVQPGLTLARVQKLEITPGDTAYEAIKRSAGEGVLIVSDGQGGITITRSGNARAASLIEGQNLLSVSADFDSSDRFRRYVMTSQIAGRDESAGDATRQEAAATDEGVRRADRVLLLRPDRGYSAADAIRRADWEARIRAARSETVTATVVGWNQPDGDIWRVNRIARVEASRLVGVSGDMLISQVEFTIGDQGRTTQLRLVRPDAFTPEPSATVRSPAKRRGGVGVGWKELKDGGL